MKSEEQRLIDLRERKDRLYSDESQNDGKDESEWKWS
jgi:hypothetical protein